MTYPNDIPTLQNMLKKRDEKIADLELLGENEGDYTALLQEYDNLKNDYQELVLLCKSKDGDIARLEGELNALTKELNHTQEQLDKECDLNVELEDKIKELEGQKAGELTEQDKNELKLLQEKLALCDKYYKKESAQLRQFLELAHEINKDGI